MADWRKLAVTRLEIPEHEVLAYQLEGGLTGSPDSIKFLEQVQQECKSKPTQVVIDMKKVDHLDSSGSGILTAAFTSITNAKGRMCLVGLSSRAEAVLNVIRFLYIVGHTDTYDGAYEYFRSHKD